MMILTYALSFSSKLPSLFSQRVGVVLCVVFAMAACEKVDHETIAKWGHTEKGPGKLLEALRGDDIVVDLRAHAAQVLIEINKNTEVMEALEKMSEGPRQEIMASLAGRLWDVARINGAMSMPTPRQSNAKDAMFYMMAFSDPPTRSKISEYLVEWFLGGHYEGRAKSGRVSGAMAMRKIGKSAGPRLMQAAQAILAAPAQERRPIGDELLKAMALSGAPDPLKLLMNLIVKTRGDPSLPKRSVSALYFAFVEPRSVEAADGKALLAIANLLEPLPYDDSLSGTTRNDAVALLAAIGAPECIPIFTKMVNYPTEHERFRWMGTQQGMRCAGVQGIEAITEALPPKVRYPRGMLSKYLWDEILAYDEPLKIAAAAGRLLRSKNPVARITGVELLGKIAGKAASPENIERLKELSSDSHVLLGWWGDQGDIPKKKRKADPTIGKRASYVAKSLAALVSGRSNK